MLKTTTDLIEYLKLEESIRDIYIIKPLVNAVLKFGDKSDANAVLLQYLTNPFEFDYSYLLPIFKKFGDSYDAQQIFDVHQDKLNEKSEILELLGELKYERIKPILADYAFGNIASDYYISRGAVLGLLNFNCDEYQNIIETEIEKCYGKNLFAEFIPALVCKLKNKKPVLEKLYELGNEYASTDCNGGIILGFSLCGEEGQAYFRQALFNPNWETCNSGTGTTVCTYKGLKNLGITFRELYEDIRPIAEKGKLMYCMDVFFALLEMKIDDFEVTKQESFSDIYALLFQSTESELIDLAERADHTTKAYEIEKLIELKMNEEVILRNYR